jgi:hypothetical protein
VVELGVGLDSATPPTGASIGSYAAAAAADSA